MMSTSRRHLRAADVTMRLTSQTHVKACFSSLRQLRSVRPLRRFFPRHALLTLVRAFVVCKVDYCISVFAGISRSLWSVLNSAARLVCSARKSEHITNAFASRTPCTSRVCPSVSSSRYLCWFTAVCTAQRQHS